MTTMGLLLRPVPGPITTPFGYDPTYPGNDAHFHHGIDFAAVTGTTVVAPCDAVLQVMQSAPVGVANVMDGAWGLTARLHLPDGRVLDYCHLSEAGTPSGMVRRGDGIALTGYSGLVFPAGPLGSHLHAHGWESLADVGDGNNRVDPSKWYEVP